MWHCTWGDLATISNFFGTMFFCSRPAIVQAQFDIFLGELSEAFEKKDGMHFGLYYSLYEWFHPLYLKDKRNDFSTQDFIKVSVTENRFGYLISQKLGDKIFFLQKKDIHPYFELESILRSHSANFCPSKKSILFFQLLPRLEIIHMYLDRGVNYSFEGRTGFIGFIGIFLGFFGIFS